MPGENIQTQELPFVLSQRIMALLSSIPTLYDSPGQQSFVNKICLDSGLRKLINFGVPCDQFVSDLVSKTYSYGTLHDGRNALEAVMETAKGYVGQEGHAECSRIIQELHALRQQTPVPSSPNSEKPPLPLHTQKVDMPANQIYEYLRQSTVRIERPDGGHGTGFFISPRRVLRHFQKNNCPACLVWIGKSTPFARWICQSNRSRLG